MSVAAPVEQPHDDVAREDLARAAAVAEPPRDDDGRAEVVGLVDERLADVEAGADLQPLARRRAPRRLLHGDRALHGVGGGVEGDHQPVAEPLHLVAAVRLDGLAQQAVVRLEDALRLLVAGALQQLGRADEVGEEDGDGLARASSSCRRIIPPIRREHQAEPRQNGGGPRSVPPTPRRSPRTRPKLAPCPRAVPTPNRHQHDV